MNRVACILVLLLTVIGSPRLEAQQVQGCGNLDNAYGPFDYRDPVNKEKNLPIVDRNHFTPDVENLVRGISSAHVIDDIDYTLRAFPNHHGALNSVARYALQGGKFGAGRIPSADCYFRRAVTFQPDDEVVRMLYGNYLAKRGDIAGARTQYEDALRLDPDGTEVNYNSALFFLSQGELARAKQLAQVAYDGGYPLPGLKKKIAAAESGNMTGPPAAQR